MSHPIYIGFYFKASDTVCPSFSLLYHTNRGSCLYAVPAQQSPWLPGVRSSAQRFACLGHVGKRKVKGRRCVGAHGSKCSPALARQVGRQLKRPLAASRQGLLALHSTALLATPELLIEHLISVGSPLHWHETGALQ